MKHKIITTLLCIFFVSMIIFGSYKLFYSIKAESKAQNTYNELKTHIKVDKFSDSDLNTINWPIVDFVSLNKESEDVVAWIYIEQLNINYPIVQGQDNNYYLNHLINGQYNKFGSIFLDYRNNSDLKDKHTIIYGHHTNTPDMFTRLEEYKEQDLLDNYPYYLIITPTKKYKIDIFASYIANPAEDAWKMNFSSTIEFDNWIETTKSKSLIKNDIIPTIDNNIITLSTCYKNSTTERFILVGVSTECI